MKHTTTPLQKRKAAIDLIESLMAESDEAYDVYNAAHDAMCEPATVSVFEDEFGNPRDLIAETRAAMLEQFGNDQAKEARS